MNQYKWDEYFINIADVVRQKSKDESTKVGAVIVAPDHGIISTGYNGFPRGIDETILERWERPIKYSFIEHAERNALYNAAKNGISINNCTLYLVGMGPPTAPCVDCAKGIIQSGIKRVVGYGYKSVPEDWIENFNFSLALLKEAGIEFDEFQRI